MYVSLWMLVMFVLSSDFHFFIIPILTLTVSLRLYQNCLTPALQCWMAVRRTEKTGCIWLRKRRRKSVKIVVLKHTKTMRKIIRQRNRELDGWLSPSFGNKKEFDLPTASSNGHVLTKSGLSVHTFELWLPNVSMPHTIIVTNKHNTAFMYIP